MKGVLKYIKREYLLLSVLVSLVLLLRIFDKEHAQFNWPEILMVFVYTLAALFINYTLLPQLFDRGKTKLFYVLILLIIILLSIFEELVFEKQYRPKRL